MSLKTKIDELEAGDFVFAPGFSRNQLALIVGISGQTLTFLWLDGKLTSFTNAYFQSRISELYLKHVKF